MAGSCNGTQTAVLSVFCGSYELWTLLAVVSAMLVLSLCWNIICCVAKLCSGSYKGTDLLPRVRGSVREMEDNPIYGNVNYIQTRVDPVDPPISSSSQMDQQSVHCDSQSQSKTQDCYANLALKPPLPQSGRSSPKIHYSDVVQLLEALEPEKEPAGDTDTVSTLSDLYASVQTQRTKTLDTAVTGDGYANHL
ncbi:signaling threshold-regulating transmembrane adapter 1-like [Centroberyx affinis]|uniref:signaling threshold-regulating transmembrane adapter 1-like n=1 Tax=Centroberyx affinis TaxID=166261 RepID=UPI003A5BF399